MIDDKKKNQGSAGGQSSQGDVAETGMGDTSTDTDMDTGVETNDDTAMEDTDLDTDLAE